MTNRLVTCASTSKRSAFLRTDMISRLGSTHQHDPHPKIATYSSQAQDRPPCNSHTSRETGIQTQAGGHGQNNPFSITSCNQGCAILPQDVPSTHSLNVNCPFHASIMRMEQPASWPTSYLTREMLANMPPAGLTQSFRVGTSSSCGCTCGQGGRQDLQKFDQDVEGTVEGTVRSPDANIQDQARPC
jgi:hypothetical protein